MIIIDELKFAYVHIPKCAGTSIKQSNPDQEMTRIDNGLGFESTHLPLSYIKMKAPVVYEKILSYDSYAHVRDPVLRFRSALFQHSRGFLDLSSAECDDDTLRRIAHDVIDFIKSSELPFPEKYEHFTPQHTYIEEDGVLVVKNVAVLGDFRLLNGFYSRNGFNTIGRPENVSRTPKEGWFSVASYVVKPFVRKLLPENLKVKIWEWLVDKGYYQSLSESSPDFLKRDPEIMSFIKDYYARDFVIYENAKKRR